MKRAALLLLVLLACAKQKRIKLRPDSALNERGVTFMPFVASQVERFVAPDDRPCERVDGRPRENFVGWQSPSEDPACIHDTLYEGLRPGVLEFQWRSEIPQDGNYDLVTLEYSVGAWGRVVSRGSYYGDYFAKAQLMVNAKAPHCGGSWSLDLAKAAVTGPWSRVAGFSGWVTIPDLVVAGCKAHETMQVTLRLQGESNRGKVEVDWFGFSAIKQEDVNRIFGLRLRQAPLTDVSHDRQSK